MVLEDLPTILESGGYGNSDPIESGARIRRNGLVVLTPQGNATQAFAAPNLLARGIALSTIDNQNNDYTSAKAGTKIGIFLFNNHIDDPVTREDIGKFAYIFDETTVCRTSTDKSIAGQIVQIEPSGDQVWVKITGVGYAR